ncbi:sugar O-acetyltransferase [Caldisalinibacter kiritimatiensis]|uniref:Acetyltransferase n=1 Tax=Caldisalinibacter kiritimatiensis TaxID=1304284 RepID=R1CUY1_9FIRM|nr:sugar O-acetyltransferase [Caldisalinibacter kiritimatiensis]EOD00454.1 Maltose O-acetyltransferase [Caldisalinibacter kiritimatiensis]
MTEKDKMLAGEFYNPADEELFADRERAKKLCKRFNDLEPNQYEKRLELLKELFQTEKECFIEPNFYCDYGYNIKFGNDFYANHNCVILDVNTVTIGNNVMFGPNVQVYTATHPINPKERNSGKEMGYPIKIGDNVWVGGGAIICPGVTIGDNVVIGAGSVVTKDIPDNVVVAGNPAKVIKKL